MRRHHPKKVRYGHWGFIFVIPFLTIFGLFQLLPVLSTVYMGFTDIKGAAIEHHLVGLANFGKTYQSFNLKNLSAEQATQLSTSLKTAGIDNFTDVPLSAESSASDLYSLDSSPSADSSQVAATTSYQLNISRVTPEEMPTLLAVLRANAIAEPVITAGFVVNYSGVIFDKLFWQSLATTLILFLMSFIPQLLFSTLFAVWFADFSLKIKLAGWFKTIFYMPNILMASAVVVLFGAFFSAPSGPINQFLVNGLHLPEPINFFRSEIWTKGITAFVQFWLFFGTTIILISAGILGIPVTIVESALIDGAKPGQIFFHITLPLLRHILLFVFVTSLISGLQLFDIPFLVGSRYVLTSSVYVYNIAFSSASNYSYASAISTGMFLVMIGLAAITFRLMRERSGFVPRKEIK